MKYKFVTVAFVFLISTPIYADEIPSCLPVQKVKIKDFFPYKKIANLKKLSPPLHTTFDSDEDDGGSYKITTLKYSSYELTIVRGEVDSVAITSPDIVWYKSIKIGMRRSDVTPLLADALVDDDADESQYVTCGPEVYVVLSYTKERLTKITVIANRP